MAAGAGIFLLVVLLPLLIMLAAGIYLIIASRRGGGGKPFPACGACGYDLSGSVGAVPRCPECGADFKIVGITPPGGQRSKPMLIVGILLLILPVTCLGWVGVMSVMNAVRPAPTPPMPAVAPLPPSGGPMPTAPTTKPPPTTPAPQPTGEAEIDTTD